VQQEEDIRGGLPWGRVDLELEEHWVLLSEGAGVRWQYEEKE